jgi:hypothetical protein
MVPDLQRTSLSPRQLVDLTGSCASSSRIGALRTIPGMLPKCAQSSWVARRLGSHQTLAVGLSVSMMNTAPGSKSTRPAPSCVLPVQRTLASL